VAYAVGFADGTGGHVRDLARGGLHAYSAVPPVVQAFFVGLFVLGSVVPLWRSLAPAGPAAGAERCDGSAGGHCHDDGAGPDAGGGQGHARGRDAGQAALGDGAESADCAAEVIRCDLLDAGDEVNLGGREGQGGQAKLRWRRGRSPRRLRPRS
jgi:hypothetical protein